MHSRTDLLNKLLIIFFIVLSNDIQATKIDSLLSLLNQTETAEQPHIYTDLAYIYLNENIPQAEIYANRALQSETIYQDTNLLIRAQLIYAEAIELGGEVDSALLYYKRALELSKHIQNHELTIEAQLLIGNIHYNWGDYKKSMVYYDNAYSLSVKTNIPRLKAKSLALMGKLEYSIGNPEKAMDYFEESRELSEKIAYWENLLALYNSIGKNHETQGDYTTALEYYLDALGFHEKVSDNILIATTYNHLGNIHMLLGNYSKSLENHYNALSIRKKIAYIEGIAKSQKNIGEVYLETGEIQKAKQEFEQSLKTCEIINYKKGIIKNLSNLGNICDREGNTSKAINYYARALELSKSMNYEKGIIINHVTLAEKYAETNNYPKAFHHLEKGREIAIANNMLPELEKVYFIYYELHQVRGEYEAALKYHILYTEVREAIFNESKSKQIAQMQVEFEISKKEQENILLKQQNEIQELRISRKNHQLLYVVMIIVLLVAFVVLFYSRYRAKKRANLQLLRLNQKIVTQNRKLDSLNKDLHVALREKDHFFEIIAHELRNPLWWFKNVAQLLSSKLDTLSREELQSTALSLEQSAINAFHLTDNLLQWARTQLGRIKYKPVEFDSKELIETSIEPFKVFSQNKQIDLSSKLAPNIKIEADRDMISTVIRNLISNSLKFTPEHGEIKVATEQKNGHLIIKVSDNGVGIAESNLKKIWKGESRISTPGLYQEKGSGLGLNLSRQFIELNNGVMTIESEQKKGTVILIQLPVKS